MPLAVADRIVIRAAAAPTEAFTKAHAGAESRQEYVEWIADVILQHGGVVTSANLGSSLVTTDPEKPLAARIIHGRVAATPRLRVESAARRRGSESDPRRWDARGRKRL